MLNVHPISPLMEPLPPALSKVKRERPEAGGKEGFSEVLDAAITAIEDETEKTNANTPDFGYRRISL